MKRLFADKKRRADLIVIASLLLLALALYLILGALRTVGGEVVVRVDGVETERHALTEDGTYPLNGGSQAGEDPLYRPVHHLSAQPPDRDGRGRRVGRRGRRSGVRI